MPRTYTLLKPLLLIIPLAIGLWDAGPTPVQAEITESNNVFGRFTAHIREQIKLDKQGFADAQVCTEWFYKERAKKPPRPAAQGVSYRTGQKIAKPTRGESDCRRRYPNGLEAAREDFSRTQSSLALSLTFYEFALVGDRNDDGRYSATELQDILESFNLSFDAERSPTVQANTLNAKFDALRKAGSLDALMVSMGLLYDKGYRLTAQDRAAIDRIAG